MKMRLGRIAAWSLVLLMVVGLNVVMASDVPEGNPFTAIWDAITYLQEQIDNLVAGSTSLKLVDSTGKVLGEVIWMATSMSDGYGGVRVFDIERNVVIDYKMIGTEAEFPESIVNDFFDSLFYVSNDCSDAPYRVVEDYFPSQYYVSQYNNGIGNTFYSVDELSSGTLTFNSVNFQGEGCEDAEETTDSYFKLKEFTFQTVVPPLSVVKQ